MWGANAVLNPCPATPIRAVKSVCPSLPHIPRITRRYTLPSKLSIFTFSPLSTYGSPTTLHSPLRARFVFIPLCQRDTSAFRRPVTVHKALEDCSTIVLWAWTSCTTSLQRTIHHVLSLTADHESQVSVPTPTAHSTHGPRAEHSSTTGPGPCA